MTVGRRPSGSRDSPEAVDFVSSCRRPLSLKVGFSVELIRREPIDEFEFVEALELFEGPLGVFFVVSAEEELTAGNQRVGYRIEEGRLHDPAFVMAGFWPRIGEEEMDAGNGLGGEEPFDGINRFKAEDLEVGQSIAVASAAEFAHPAEEALDPEKAPFREALGHGEEERSVSTAQIDLQRSRIGEDFCPLETPKIVRGEQFVVFRGSLQGGGRGGNVAHGGVLACPLSTSQGDLSVAGCA